MSLAHGAEHKLALVHERLTQLADKGRFALAFSGGLDSRFLAHTAQLAGLEPVLLHAQGPHMALREHIFAQTWAQEHRFACHTVPVNPLEVPEVAANSRMRCYHCKHFLFSALLHTAGGLPLLDGTQASDACAYRPGIVALRELGIISPLADAGLTKAEIRALAAATAMTFPQQQARPCLLTRFAYDLRPDEKTLAGLARAEEGIESVLRLCTLSGDTEIPDFRLRMTQHGTELHIRLHTDVETGIVPVGMKKRLEILVRAATGTPLACIRIMPSLSGFFDRTT